MKRQKLYPGKGKLSVIDGNTATWYKKRISHFEKERLEDYIHKVVARGHHFIGLVIDMILIKRLVRLLRYSLNNLGIAGISPEFPAEP